MSCAPVTGKVISTTTRFKYVMRCFSIFKLLAPGVVFLHLTLEKNVHVNTAQQ